MMRPVSEDAVADLLKEATSLASAGDAGSAGELARRQAG